MSVNNAKFNAARSGVYCTPPAVMLVRKQARAGGVAWFDLKLNLVSGKKQFLAICGNQLEFPNDFGGNWDAFADGLRDFSWRKDHGYVLHLQHAARFAKSAPEDYATALEVLRLAADFWKERGTPFVVLVDDAADLPQ